MLRVQADWTKSHLSLLSGVHESSIKALENDYAKVSLYTITALAKAFNLTLSQLLEGVEIKPRTDNKSAQDGRVKAVQRMRDAGMTFTDIGRELGISKQTTRTIWHRAELERKRQDVQPN